MDRASAWGVEFDTSVAGQITASFRERSITLPYDPARDAVIKADILWRVIQRLTERPEPPGQDVMRRLNYAYYSFKVLAYQERIQDLNAQIAAYPRLRDVPPALIAERAALVAKRDRLIVVRDEARNAEATI